MPLSYSQLSLYQTCPRQYEFACVKKLPRGISAGESFGSSVHGALAKWGRSEIENGKLRMENSGGQIPLFTEPEAELPTSYQLQATSLEKLWHTSFITEGYSSKLEADRARARGEKVMERLYEWWVARERKVLGVEMGFRIILGGLEGKEVERSRGLEGKEVRLTGRFDRVEEVEGGLKVIDFKTSKVRSQEDVDRDLQLSLYALACEETFGKPCVCLSLLFLSEDVAVEVVTTRSAKQLKEAKQQIQKISEGIAQRAFSPDPSVEKCSRCPYANVCDTAML